MANTVTLSPAVIAKYVGDGSPATLAYVIANVKAELAVAAPGQIVDYAVLTRAEADRRVATLNALLAALEARAIQEAA